MPQPDFVGIATLISAVSGAIVSVIGAFKASTAKNKIEAVRGEMNQQAIVADVKRDEVRLAAARTSEIVAKNADVVVGLAAKTDVIEGHVNSHASASLERIDSLQRELQLTKDLLAAQQHQTSMLAQTLATQSVAAGSQTVVLPPAATPPALDAGARDRRKDDH